MAFPAGPLYPNVEAISGITGSISIAAWVVVFSPQILENFRRGSADGLSLYFIIVWLLGDVFNILGSVFQGVLPTMLILAIYYTLADMVLLAQCFYYRGFTLSDEVETPPAKRSRVKATDEPDERSGLLQTSTAHRERRGSAQSWSHLSPAVPLVSEPPSRPPPTPTKLQAFLWNTVAVFMVCAAGIGGWVLSRHYAPDTPTVPTDDHLPQLDLWGQIFGWLCAVLYLGSRLPQILLNWRRKSTEGVSILFFLFACLGNLTYVMSIFAYEPRCMRLHNCESGEAVRTYWKYILVNASWLAGSLGTLLLDLIIFAQFFMYDQDGSSTEDNDDHDVYSEDHGSPNPN